MAEIIALVAGPALVVEEEPRLKRGLNAVTGRLGFVRVILRATKQQQNARHGERTRRAKK